jgi:hypothetical protein
LIASSERVIFNAMNMQTPIKRSTLDTPEKRRAAADKAIALAQKMKRSHVGNASDILIAERRLEFWREELEFLTRSR